MIYISELYKSCVLTHSSKRQRADRKMHQTVVGQQSSAGGLVSHSLYHLHTKGKGFTFMTRLQIDVSLSPPSVSFSRGLRWIGPIKTSGYLFILCEDVEGQRFFPFVDELDGFVQAAHGHDGQQRPKYLLLHHLRLWLHIPEDCGG